MDFNGVEKAFSRAILFSASKKKLLLTFPALVLCGVFTVFCKAVALGSSDWIAMSLAFLPILLSSGVLLALGVMLIRMHALEVRSSSYSLKELFQSSAPLLMETSYFSIPPVLVYLLLWMVLGIFYLFREIPGLGNFFSVVFSFGPFLLILGSLLLCFINLLILFFVAPIAAFQNGKKAPFLKRLTYLFQGRILSRLSLFFLALVPIGAIVGFLTLAAFLTSISEKPLSIAMEWFFIMIPFAALLSPAVVFFFNFAAESYQLLKEAPSS